MVKIDGSTAVKGMLGALAQFPKDQSGAIAILFALILAPLLLAVGMSIDYGHASTYQTSVQRVLDEAVIAGATTLAKTDSASKAEVTALRRFNATKPTTYEIEIHVTVDSQSRNVVADATANVPMSFMSLAGYKHLKVAARAIASAKRAPRRQAVRQGKVRQGKTPAVPRLSDAKVRDLIDRVQRLCYQLKGSGFAARVPQCQAVFNGSFASQLRARLESKRDAGNLLPTGVRLVQ